jgi:hypothetical protein
MIACDVPAKRRICSNVTTTASAAHAHFSCRWSLLQSFLLSSSPHQDPRNHPRVIRLSMERFVRVMLLLLLCLTGYPLLVVHAWSCNPAVLVQSSQGQLRAFANSHRARHRHYSAPIFIAITNRQRIQWHHLLATPDERMDPTASFKSAADAEHVPTNAQSTHSHLEDHGIMDDSGKDDTEDRTAPPPMQSLQDFLDELEREGYDIELLDTNSDGTTDEYLFDKNTNGSLDRMDIDAFLLEDEEDLLSLWDDEEFTQFLLDSVPDEDEINDEELEDTSDITDSSNGIPQSTTAKNGNPQINLPVAATATAATAFSTTTTATTSTFTTKNNSKNTRHNSILARPSSLAALENALLQGVVPVSAGVGSDALPGDYGFDPLHLASQDYIQRIQVTLLNCLPQSSLLSMSSTNATTTTTPATSSLLTYTPRPKALILRDYREAEIRHGRLAMLAAVLWPLQEQIDEAVALSSIHSATVIGGPLLYGPVTLPYIPLGMTAILLLLGYLDIYSQAVKEIDQLGEAFVPGDCFWDPLHIIVTDGSSNSGTTPPINTTMPFSNLVPNPTTTNFYYNNTQNNNMLRNMQERELLNGRAAMIAVGAFLWEEGWTHQPLAHIPGNELLLRPVYEIPEVQAWLDDQFAFYAAAAASTNTIAAVVSDTTVTVLSSEAASSIPSTSAPVILESTTTTGISDSVIDATHAVVAALTTMMATLVLPHY